MGLLFNAHKLLMNVMNSLAPLNLQFIVYLKKLFLRFQHARGFLRGSLLCGALRGGALRSGATA